MHNVWRGGESSNSTTRGEREGILSRRTLYYASRAFHCVVANVVQYFSNTLNDEEVAILTSILTLPLEAKELYLRVLSRRPQYFPVSSLHERYSETIHVADAVQQLDARGLLLQFSGDDFFHDSDASTQSKRLSVLRTAKVTELKEVAKNLHRARDLTAQPIPSSKEALVPYVMGFGSDVANAWDDVMGAVVTPLAVVKSTVSFVFELFGVLTDYDAAALLQRKANTAPQMASCSVVLSTLNIVTFPMLVKMPPIPPPPPANLQPESSEPDSAAPSQAVSQRAKETLRSALSSQGVYETPQSSPSQVLVESTSSPKGGRTSLSLFSSRESLSCFLDAFHCWLELGVVVETNDRVKAHSTTWVEEMAATVTKGLEAARRLLNAEGLVPSATDDNITVCNLLYVHHRKSYRYRYMHLIRFLPLWKWCTCVEYLVELLQGVKRHADANRWLKYLLTSCIYPILPNSPNIARYRRASNDSSWEFSDAFQELHPEFCFRSHHRGGWIGRYALNLDHMKSPVEALHVLREALERNAADPAAPLAYIRRADRLAIERTLLRLWVPPRRWDAPPKQLLSDRIVDGTHIVVHGRREKVLDLTAGSNAVVGRSFWSSGIRNDTSVESCALAWYVNGRGRKERGWSGAHDEGAWASSLFMILLYDAIFETQHGRNDVTSLDANNRTLFPRFEFLSGYQTYPYDLYEPLGSFYLHRKDLIDSTLEHFANCSREEFVAHVAQFVKEHANEACLGIRWDLPLHSISKVVPQRALCQLFGWMLGDLSGGFAVRFSGFPDLVLWRDCDELSSRNDTACEGQAVEGRQSSERRAGAPANGSSGAPLFILSEVKSPNDHLSDKQVAVIDALLRCGFCVEVCHVAEATSSAPQGVAPLRRRASRRGAAGSRSSKPASRKETLVDDALMDS